MMSTQKSTLLAVFCLSASLLTAQDKVAEQIMKGYDEQWGKLKKTTVEKLKARQTALEKSGKTDDAEEIQTMIDDMEVQADAKEKMITVTAASRERGTKLGNFKKGDKITFQYVKGLITPNKESIKLGNPDAGDPSGLIELFAKPKANVPDDSLTSLPKGTAQTPFSYEFENNTKNVSLRLIWGGGAWIPDGEVVYKITIERN